MISKYIINNNNGFRTVRPRTFRLKHIWSKGRLFQRTFSRKDVWSNGRLVQSTFGPNVLWTKMNFIDFSKV